MQELNVKDLKSIEESLTIEQPVNQGENGVLSKLPEIKPFSFEKSDSGLR